MSWQAGVRGPAFLGDSVGFEIRRGGNDRSSVPAAAQVIVEAQLTEDVAGLLLAAVEWAGSRFESGGTASPESAMLASARRVLERGLADGDDGLIAIRLDLGQITMVTAAAHLCAEMSGLDPYLEAEMTAGARSLHAAAALAPVARELGLGCRDRMSSAPFSVN